MNKEQVSAGFIGYAFRPLSPLIRIGIIIGGFALLMPAEIGAWAAWTDIAGLILSVGLLTYEYLAVRRERTADVPLTVPGEHG